MRRGTFSRTTLCLYLLTATLVAAPAWAQPPGGRGIFGDWQVRIPFGERQMDVILSFAPAGQGNWAGQWISAWGMNELKDIRFSDGNLRFVHVARFGDDEFTSTFSGEIDGDRLTGVLSSEQGESDVVGRRSPRISPAVGRWQMKFTLGDREVTTLLVVTPDGEGRLGAQWESTKSRISPSSGAPSASGERARSRTGSGNRPSRALLRATP